MGWRVAHNGQWLINYASTQSVVELLEDAAFELASETVYIKLFSRGQLRMNAAFTKVYSLIMDDFLIYDSRVAAALCMIIVHYLEKSAIRLFQKRSICIPCLPKKAPIPLLQRIEIQAPVASILQKCMGVNPATR